MANMKLTFFGHSIGKRNIKLLKDLQVGDWVWYACDFAHKREFQYNKIVDIAQVTAEKAVLITYIEKGFNEYISVRIDEPTDTSLNYNRIVTTNEDDAYEWVKEHPKVNQKPKING